MSSLVINTNLSAINAYNNLNATDNQLNNVISELSSGLQIQTAADNPAGYVISQGLEAQANGYQQAIANAQNGVSLIQTASGALNQIESILQTMNQLATASANGATNDSSSHLLDGTFTGQVLQVGAFDYPSQQVHISIQSVTTTALGVASTNVSVGSAASAQAAMSAVQAAIATVASVEASVGAVQNQLEAVVANLTVGQQNLQAAYSQLVDVNFAQATTQFTTDQILEQSGVAMLSQAQQAPALALKLLP
ncbi:flagellin N-terminal helical domain-containing protein [Aciditerrimonas ferrireducens]|uniref:flagellin N-terminal helical domain-containing protein n=1 Tax=Aciditerrimonas ferrireducens TaxID=667306 RepID=UPI0020064580|nr:flagellin [Aciditerrimonas ferrireducens]MCK4177609.1 hypothetical protein [Aciditerrimonas ferrireducens]